MKALNKQTSHYLIKVGMLAFLLIDIPVYAALYNEEDSGLEGAQFHEFSFSELPEIQQSSPLDQVNKNYQFVINLVKQKKYTEAEKKLAVFIQNDPKQSRYYDLKALLAVIDKNPVEAEQSFLKAIELNDKNVMAYTGLARLLLDAKKYDLAAENVHLALAINPYAISAYKVLADILMQQKGVDAVEKMLLDAHLKVKDKLNSELEVLKLLGHVYSIKKQPQSLLPLAEDLVQRNKNNPDALSYLAGAQLANNNTVAAEKTLRLIIAMRPTSAEHQFLLAKLLSKQSGKASEVLELLDQAQANLDNPTVVMAYKVAFLIAQQQYKKAFTLAEKMEVSYPNIAIGKILKGDVYLAEKKYPEALQSYQQAYQLTPNLKVLDVMLGILTIQHKQDEAITLLKKELEKYKDNENIQFRLAQFYQELGHYDLSIQYYEMLLAKQENNALILNNLAWAYSQKNNPKALKIAEKAYRNAPDSGTVADTYGYILLHAGNSEEAVKVLEQAVKLASNVSEIQLHLAEAYIANQNKPEARRILNNLVDTNSAEKVAASKLLAQL